MRWIAAVLVFAVAACGNGGDADLKPLSDDQAARLAQAGYHNLLAGGAEFEANSAVLVGNGNRTVLLMGVIDWERHAGRATVTISGADDGITEVYWTEDAVYERWPEADATVSAMGGPARPWIVRAPQPQTRQLDRLLGVVLGLALEQPENALLIQQREGSAFMREDELLGRPVEVLRFGTRSLYWLALDDASMLRFEGNSSAGASPTVVDFLRFGKVAAEAPAGDDVVPVESLPGLYAALLSE